MSYQYFGGIPVALSEGDPLKSVAENPNKVHETHGRQNIWFGFA